MLNLNIIDGLFGALMETAFGKTADAFEKRKAFKQDLLTFLHDQQKHTSLDVFLFSRRPKYGTEENPEDFLTLEEIYIPLRLNQLRSTLPDFQKLRQTTDEPDDLTDQKIEDLHIGKLLDLMQYNEATQVLGEGFVEAKAHDAADVVGLEGRGLYLHGSWRSGCLDWARF